MQTSCHKNHINIHFSKQNLNYCSFNYHYHLADNTHTYTHTQWHAHTSLRLSTCTTINKILTISNSNTNLSPPFHPPNLCLLLLPRSLMLSSAIRNETVLVHFLEWLAENSREMVPRNWKNIVQMILRFCFGIFGRFSLEDRSIHVF